MRDELPHGEQPADARGAPRVPLSRRRCSAGLALAAAAATAAVAGPGRAQAGMFGRLPLPPERPHVGPMKPVSSARTTEQPLPSGQRLLTIEHDVIRGVTPTMLRWWFENLGRTMTWRGTVYPRYLLWHPRDHIHWELAARSPGGGSGEGARFRIVEAFGANPDFYVDSVELVEKLDDEGISLVRRELGHEVFRLEHRFGSVAAGATYRSRMVVGMASGWFAGAFNSLVRPRVFSDAMGTAWLTHNVEEVSMLEHLLPPLYAARAAG